MKKILLFLTLSLFSCWKETEPTLITRPIRTEIVQPLSNYQKEYIGLLEADESTKLAFGVSGQILKIGITSGSVVKRGDILAKLDDNDFRLKVNAEKATYQTNLAALNRAEILTERGALSKQNYEMAKAKYEASKARYNFAMTELKNTILRAPYSGSIETTYVDTYQEITAGQPICKLINPEKLYVTVTIPQNDIPIITPRQKFSFQVDGSSNEIFSAELREIVDASVDGAGIPISLEITDKNFNPEKLGIKAGFSCKVWIEVDENLTNKDYCTIPLTAIWTKSTDPTNNFVWIYNPKTESVQSRKIESSGLIGTANVIVKNGLTPNESVAIAGVYQLTENQKVKLLPKK